MDLRLEKSNLDKIRRWNRRCQEVLDKFQDAWQQRVNKMSIEQLEATARDEGLSAATWAQVGNETAARHRAWSAASFAREAIRRRGVQEAWQEMVNRISLDRLEAIARSEGLSAAMSARSGNERVARQCAWSAAAVAREVIRRRTA